jgi:hypothetical protein
MGNNTLKSLFAWFLPILVSLFFIGCASMGTEAGQSSAQSISAAGKPKPGDLLVCVDLSSKTYLGPAIWDNGTVIPLPLPPGGIGSSTGIAVDRAGNVYVSGAILSSTEYPVYWKNGTLTDLPVETGYTAETTGIAIDSSGNVFIGATISKGDSVFGGYWKNGILTIWQQPLPPLPPLSGTPYTPSGRFHSIAVDADGNVYLLGNSLTGSHDRDRPKRPVIAPFYLKNGQPNMLPMGPRRFYGEAKNIAVDPKGNIYIVGNSSELSKDNGDPPDQWKNAIYWHNFSFTVLSYVGEISTEAEGVALNGSGDVYILGRLAADNCYWYNGQPTPNVLPPDPSVGESGTFTDAITVDNFGNVYIVGTAFDGKLSKLICWKNRQQIVSQQIGSIEVMGATVMGP